MNLPSPTLYLIMRRARIRHRFGRIANFEWIEIFKTPDTTSSGYGERTKAISVCNARIDKTVSGGGGASVDERFETQLTT